MTTDRQPNDREMRVLRGLYLGDIEAEGRFADVGQKTFDALATRDWIEPTFDETYDTDGWRVTDAGKAADETGS